MVCWLLSYFNPPSLHICVLLLWVTMPLFSLPCLSVYHRKQATKSSQLNPVYCLLLHMFQSLCEPSRLLMRGYNSQGKPDLLSSCFSSSSYSRSSEILIHLSLLFIVSLCFFHHLFSLSFAGKHDASRSHRGLLRCFGPAVVFLEVIWPLTTPVQLSSTWKISNAAVGKKNMLRLFYFTCFFQFFCLFVLVYTSVNVFFKGTVCHS